MFTWDFISGEVKYFHFGVWSVSVYMIQPKMKLVSGVVSMRSFWQKWNFISADQLSCKHYPKWNHMKGNICTCVNKNDWLLLSGPFISGHPRNEIRFISPTMKSNINRISFIVDWNFVSGRFHFGSHVNTPLVYYPFSKFVFNWFVIWQLKRTINILEKKISVFWNKDALPKRNPQFKEK